MNANIISTQDIDFSGSSNWSATRFLRGDGTWQDNSGGTIMGTIPATAGLIPFASGVLDTITTSGLLSFNGTTTLTVPAIITSAGGIALTAGGANTDLKFTAGTTGKSHFITTGTYPAIFEGSATGTGIGQGVGFLIANTNATTNNRVEILFSDASFGAASALIGTKFTDRINHYGDFYVLTRSGAGVTEKLYITSTGLIGLGVSNTSPVGAVDILSTTEQLRIRYNASNYYSVTVGSTGIVTFNAVGSASSFIFNDTVFCDLGLSVNESFSNTGGFVVWDSGSDQLFSATPLATPTIGFFANSAVRQVSGAYLTNNVTSGGTDDQIDNYNDLVIYANDAATIRNNIYQLARKLKQVNDGLRNYGLLS